MRSFFFCIGLLPLLFGACAQVHPPSGGPEDRKPPQVVKAVPPNGKVNFKGNRFTLHFDEYIRKNRIQKELIVSPPIRPSLKVHVEGKKLIVEWNQKLQPARTYSFRFGNSIQDITEGNRTNDLVYAFSTGDHLDSLHFEGRIVDARKMKGVEGVLAMLYRELADSVPRRKEPFSFARTDEKGHFDIPYLAKGRYKFFALKDQNRNQRFDLPDEAIGFIENPISPYEADSSGDALIRLFQEAHEKQYVEERSIEAGRAFFRTKQDAKKVALQPLGKEDLPWDHVKYHPIGSDTAIYWFPDPKMPDSLKMRFSAEGNVLDTFLIRNGRSLRKDGKGFRLEKGFEDPLERNQAAAFSSPHPLRSIDPSAIVGVSDSDTVAVDPSIEGMADRELVLNNRKAFRDSGLQLTLLPGAVIDTFGRENRDTLKYNFKVRPKDHYGKLRIRLQTSDTVHRRVILRLLDPSSGKAVRRRSRTTEKAFWFPYLHPGAYRVELILDRLPNGKWDPGNYPVRQPEPVLYYPDTVDIRSNWEKELKWKGIGG